MVVVCYSRLPANRRGVGGISYVLYVVVCTDQSRIPDIRPGRIR